MGLQVKVFHICYTHCYVIQIFGFFQCCSSTVVSIFPPPLSSTPPNSTSHPHSFSPLALPMGPLYMFLDNPFPSFPHYPSPFPSLVTVSLFFITASLVIFCLLFCFVDWVPLIGEITCYLSFTTWLMPLSITLSSSIHTVVKGRSSFFLSVAWYSDIFN